MNKFIRIFLFLVLFLGAKLMLNAQSRIWTVETVPNPKSSYNGYVANPDRIIDTQTQFSIDKIARQIDDSSKIEIAVVVLQSIGENVPKDFATELFNLWGVGKKGANNGLLILMVLDQRRVEFETGYGMESILTDIQCVEIQQQFMVPEFKNENYSAGLLNAMQYLKSYLLNQETDFTFEEPQNSTSNGWKTVLIIYLLIVGVAFLLFVLWFFIAINIKDLLKRYHFMNLFAVKFWMFIFPIPFIFIYRFVKQNQKKWRDTPRYSEKTGMVMQKLSEVEDDEFLQKGQITEENINSIDYDVWITEDREDILIIPYKTLFSSYSKCPSCSYKTYYFVSSRVIIPATTHSTGMAEKTFSCKNCKVVHNETVIIPRIQRSSGGSSGRSSGGGSFGGGRSGGGGGGSSW